MLYGKYIRARPVWVLRQKYRHACRRKLSKQKMTDELMFIGLIESGDDLSSQAVASQVLSTREGLTSVFGMGTGGTPQPLSPENVFLFHAA